MDELIREFKALRTENESLSAKVDKMEQDMVSMNKTIADMKILLENSSKTKKKRESKKSKEPKEPRVQCSAKTAKGEQCKKSCASGHPYCLTHMKKMAGIGCCPPKEETAAGTSGGSGSEDKKVLKKPAVKKPTVKKKKPPPPMHNHGIDEVPKSPCTLCESHGDVFDPDLPDKEWEDIPVNGKSLEARLKEMLENDEKGDVPSDSSNQWADMNPDDDLPPLPPNLRNN